MKSQSHPVLLGEKEFRAGAGTKGREERLFLYAILSKYGREKSF